MTETAMDPLIAFLNARLDEDEAIARDASGGTVVGEPRNWKPAPGGDEWEVHADLVDGDYGPDGDLEVLVALRPGLPRPPDVMGGYWGAVVSWQNDLSDRGAGTPERQFRHMALHDPASALRDIAADRKLIAACQRARQAQPSSEWESDYTQALEDAVRIRAERFSAHPDYRDEWKP